MFSILTHLEGVSRQSWHLYNDIKAKQSATKDTGKYSYRWLCLLVKQMCENEVSVSEPARALIIF